MSKTKQHLEELAQKGEGPLAEDLYQQEHGETFWVAGYREYEQAPETRLGKGPKTSGVDGGNSGKDATVSRPDRAAKAPRRNTPCLTTPTRTKKASTWATKIIGNIIDMKASCELDENDRTSLNAIMLKFQQIEQKYGENKTA
jgi:hypothetical protein